MTEQHESSPSTPPESRFSLKHLFYAVTWIAVGMSLSPVTIGFSVMFLWAWWWPRGNRAATLALGKGLLAFVVVLLIMASLSIASVTYDMPRERLSIRRSMFIDAGGEVDHRLRIDRILVVCLYPLLAFLPAIIAYFRKPESIDADSV